MAAGMLGDAELPAARRGPPGPLGAPPFSQPRWNPRAAVAVATARPLSPQPRPPAPLRPFSLIVVAVAIASPFLRRRNDPSTPSSSPR